MDSPADTEQVGRLTFLTGGGAMGATMRAHAWSESPLGPPESWPQSLKVLVGVMLGSHQPMFVSWGLSRTMLYNAGYATLLGKRHPAALGQPFAEVWFDILDDVGPILERAYAGESTHMDDIALVMTRNGYAEEAHFSFSYTPVRDESGAVAGMFCACAETTEQVLAERRRIDEAERLRQLFDRAPSFIAVLRGADHVFEMTNAAYLRLIGKRDIIGKPVREALPELHGQGFFELLDGAYRTGEPFTGQAVAIMLERTPGAATEQRSVDFVFQPIVEGDGSVSGIFAEGHDITDRVVAEQKLRESEERFRLIADSAPVPVWVSRLDRKRSFVNRAYVEFMGISYEQALEYDWRDAIHPDDAERIIAESLAGEASLERFTLEARFRRADGEWRWLRSVSQPRWGVDGTLAGFIGVAHDITDWKRGEDVLRIANESLEARVEARTAELRAALDRLQAEVGERERAEAALRQAQKMEAVGQLTGGIAHDFNNLLTPVIGGLEILARSVEDARLKRIAQAALESGRRGAKLTGQLLAFSRIQRIRMAPVEVNAVIGSLRVMLRHAVGPAISVLTDLDDAAGFALCDENQLENAILNLAINARDAMPDGGSLTISTRLVREPPGAELDGGDYVCIAVTDTGCGMTADVAARATEPFFSTKPLGKGTGLGLAQVYGIARQSGGTLRIDSREREGTTVRLILPRTAADIPAVAAEAEGLPPTATADARRNARILVVDDDDDVRAFLADILANLGHRVETRDGADAALATLAGPAPDLMLIDFAMPGMNGAQLAREARRLHPDLPIVFVTGFAESDQLEEALGGDVAVLHKPFGVADLAGIVAAQLDSSKGEAKTDAERESSASI